VHLGVALIVSQAPPSHNGGVSEPKTILIADDDENDIFFMKRLLGKTGEYRLHIVHDGSTAIHYLAGDGEFADRARFPAPCCVILDLKLPHKDGLEILEWMQTHAEVAHIPALVCSGSQSSAEITRARELGASSFLTKPPDLRRMRSFMAAVEQ
jgi:CheY-like chemotaxis protein